MIWNLAREAAWERADEAFLPGLEATQRAQAAEAKLRAVSEVLEEKLERLEMHYGDGYQLASEVEMVAKEDGDYVRYEDYEAFKSQLRTIVEGKC